MARALVPLLLSSMVAVLAGCSGADRPAPAGDGSAGLIAEEGVGTTGQQPVDDLGNQGSACTPREARACRWYFTDSSGRPQCPWSYQLCQLDGKDWTPCGERVLDQDGNIVPL